MQQQLFVLLLALSLFGTSRQGLAQGAGSTTTYGGPLSTLSVSTGGTTSDFSESLYIGPGNYTIDGTWEIYSKQVVIDPGAIITGTGSIVFYNPSIAGGAASATLIDGNASSNNIDVNMKLQNGSGMQLTNIAFPSDLVAAGFVNNATASSLYVGKDLDLAVDGADVTLGTGVVGDLRFDIDATVSEYQPSRMVIVNNSILSHMVKENCTSAFTFPVGIADGDYTPAQITNTTAITVHVGVQDYGASLSPEVTVDPGPGGIPADGMNRTWHIFGDVAGTGTTINLEHNISTDQSGFNDANYFVTQWGNATPNTSGDNTVPFSASPWQTNTAGPGTTGTLSTTGTIAGSSMRNRVYSALATSGAANQSYYTKSADPVHPLPVRLLSFMATPQQCDVLVSFSTGIESGMKEYDVQNSTDGIHYSTIATIATKGSNSSYSYLHINPAKGENLYRLQMQALDGTYTLSSVATVSVDCKLSGQSTELLLYPNPTAGAITVSGMTGEPTQIRVLNLHGQVVRAISTISTIVSLDISELPVASYVVQVVANSAILLNQKVVKL